MSTPGHPGHHSPPGGPQPAIRAAAPSDPGSGYRSPTSTPIYPAPGAPRDEEGAGTPRNRNPGPAPAPRHADGADTPREAGTADTAQDASETGTPRNAQAADTPPGTPPGTPSGTQAGPGPSIAAGTRSGTLPDAPSSPSAGTPTSPAEGTPRAAESTGTPRHTNTAPAPRDTDAAGPPKDTGTAGAPGHADAAGTPRDAETVDTPQDACAAGRPRNAATADSPSRIQTDPDSDAAASTRSGTSPSTPSNHTSAGTPTSPATGTPRNAGTAPAPWDTDRAGTPRDADLAGAPGNAGMAGTPRDAGATGAPRDTARAGTSPDTPSSPATHTGAPTSPAEGTPRDTGEAGTPRHAAGGVPRRAGGGGAVGRSETVGAVPRRAWVRRALALAGLAAACVVGLLVAVAVGSVAVPLDETARVLLGSAPLDPRWQVIVGVVRVPRALTAALAGAGLGVAGLQMQTLFRNPLADPYVLGVSSGASLGVALVVAGSTTVGGGFTASLAGMGRIGVVVAAAGGSAAVLGLVMTLARWVRSPVTLLIVGVMIGAVTTALVGLLLTIADPRRAQQFVLWGLGSFASTTRGDLTVLTPAVALGLAVAAASTKPLNALLLGEGYARTMGVRVRAVRTLTLASAALLAGAVTAFCGPVGFLGMAVPHLARLTIGTSDHRVLVPATLLMGAVAALACAVVANLPVWGTVLPVNVITALLVAPVVIGVLLRSRRMDPGAVA